MIEEIRICLPPGFYWDCVSMRRPSFAGSEILQKLNHRLDMLAELLCNLIPAFNGGPHVLALFGSSASIRSGQTPERPALGVRLRHSERCMLQLDRDPPEILADRSRPCGAGAPLARDGAAAKSAEAVSSAQFGRMPTALRLARAGNIIPYCDGDAAKVDQGRKLE
ncbi:hypothetical protein IYX23_00210 [Methylocystis sp. L43]|uniref:hypothetical protein n=1 Tax=unclassified Methylocystis TaxID=2625913 RepID=UPI0018C2AB88|nr:MULTISPECIES: hypothetical protein [unclassified Methylocystis]MBG0796139.1 hypothetical protein [Methylocystis sp. L43]MBG0804072.1 hypothetical protein [Methylocystis sp. H15]